MREYKVSTPHHGVFFIYAETNTQARYDIARKREIRNYYPRLSIAEIAMEFSAHVKNPGSAGGRHPRCFNY